ncbi:diguanylate cyclase [Crinalium epipsammum PCC 9333]|uniref:Diguanylate cyclase n=1 Tax=Crinalium epipsammum PCC 9333 TaxID=1173022 RepID=K9W505_9CYAN|nr:AAA-like domain-containing protein [Crinalium epipsammum]AFZ14879.1 diguanylate cyclase [Crinalium epipsammum PCC 9333]
MYSSNTTGIVADLEFPGSPVPLHSQFYIERPPIETRAYAEIEKPGSLLRIKASRRMGKSSLLLRVIHQATTLNYTTVTIDFQQADTSCFDSLNKFLRWFSINVARQLRVDPNLDDYWDEDIGSKVSCTIYFENYLLELLATPVVLILNEVNRVFEYPTIAQDFLALLRFWHEQAKRSHIWQKLRLVMAHSTEVYVPLKIEQSPFNVGLPLRLPEFDAQQVQELACRYKLNCSNREIDSLMEMVGGHPYLVHLAFYQIHHQNLTLDQVLQDATTPTGIYSDHLRSCWVRIQKHPELVDVLQLVKAEEGICLDPSLTYQLDSMGLVKLTGDTCQLSCKLYQIFFREKICSEQPVNISRIGQLEQENQRLQELANTDVLTQIPNRRAFDERLQNEWKRMAREVAPLSLILCDIDYFKHYNDTYGHLAGDNCLRQVAQLLHQSVKRPSDFVARYGGEEFGIVLPKTNSPGAMQLGEAIRSRIKIAMLMLGNSGVTISLGVASIIPDLNSSIDELVLATDKALYESKRQGRDRVTLSSMPNFRV